MKKMNKTVLKFSLIAIVLTLAITVKAIDIKKSKALFQQSKTLVTAWILDEKGNKIEGAIARIKGREDQPLQYGQTSDNSGMITLINYPVNAIIVISKPGYVTKEIDTKKLYKPKGMTPTEMAKCVIKVKMISEKKGGKQTVKKKKV